jgi:hypothetical protein
MSRASIGGGPSVPNACPSGLTQRWQCRSGPIRVRSVKPPAKSHRQILTPVGGAAQNDLI